MSVAQTFDPDKHILVVRDATTGRHVHVIWADVLKQIAAAPLVAASVDLAPIIARLEAIERGGVVMPALTIDADPARMDAIERRVNDLESKIPPALQEVAASFAKVVHRISDMDNRLITHQHNYKLNDEQLQVIASAVLAQMANARAA